MQYVTTREASEITHMRVEYICGLIRRGELHGAKKAKGIFAHIWLIPLDVLRTWMDEHGKEWPIKRSRTSIHPRRMTAQLASRDLIDDDAWTDGSLLPATRAECLEMQRPCPYVSCKYHLYCDIKPSGSIHIYNPDIPPWEMGHTCALDIADKGPLTLEQVGKYLGVSRERMRQILMAIQKKIRLRQQGRILKEYLQSG